MTIWGSGSTTDCDRRLKEENRQLRDEIDQARYDRERQQEAQERERDQERRDRQAEREERMRSAETWPEAFAKGLVLFRREAASEAQDNVEIAAAVAKEPELAGEAGYDISTYFQDMPDKIRKAEAIYNEEMARIEEQIAALRAGALAATAERVKAEVGAQELAQALRDDTPDYLTNW